MLAPDFPTGGELLWDPDAIREIYETGRGSVRVRAKYRYVKSENLIEIYEIPYSTTSEAILDKVEKLIKAGKVKEISDMRDETDLSGLKLAIDLKRGADPDKLMSRLYKSTPLEDSFACNFNVLIHGVPQTLGVRDILTQWTAWRVESVRRRVAFVLQRREERLHLLRGLQKILLDIDRAVKIIRETQEESEVVPNLMIGFGIDKTQAEYVAEIKLRNLNREYLLKRTEEIGALEAETADLKATLDDPKRVRKIIADELKAVGKKYGEPRRTTILYQYADAADVEDETPAEYPVNVFLSREGYFKKITPLSLRMGGEQKFKEGDELRQSFQTTSGAEIMFFTDRCQVYKTRLSEFDDTKASVLGDYLPAKLGMDSGENVLYAVLPGDYSGHLLFFFENGKAARVPLSSYDTKSNRRRLTGAYSDKSPLVSMLFLTDETEIALYSTEPRCLLFHTSALAPKASRNTQGVNIMTLKEKYALKEALPASETPIVNAARYRAKSIPGPGALLRQEDTEEKQLTIL